MTLHEHAETPIVKQLRSLEEVALTPPVNLPMAEIAHDALLLIEQQAQTITTLRAFELLVQDLRAEYAEDDTREAVEACQGCRSITLCSFHSILSALAGRTWTTGAIERAALAAVSRPHEDAQNDLDYWRRNKP